jgi:hypothetical protein
VTFGSPIRVEGLRELQAALKAFDGESQKALRVALNNAVEGIASDARRRVPTRSGKARASIRATSSQREARVSAGKKAVPYYGWLDYGGKTGIGRSIDRPFRKAGRYLYPAYEDQKDEMLAKLTREIVAVAGQAGLRAG